MLAGAYSISIGIATETRSRALLASPSPPNRQGPISFGSSSLSDVVLSVSLVVLGMMVAPAMAQAIPAVDQEESNNGELPSTWLDTRHLRLPSSDDVLVGLNVKYSKWEDMEMRMAQEKSGEIQKELEKTGRMNLWHEASVKRQEASSGETVIGVVDHIIAQNPKIDGIPRKLRMPQMFLAYENGTGEIVAVAADGGRFVIPSALRAEIEAQGNGRGSKGVAIPQRSGGAIPIAIMNRTISELGERLPRHPIDGRKGLRGGAIMVVSATAQRKNRFEFNKLSGKLLHEVSKEIGTGYYDTQLLHIYRVPTSPFEREAGLAESLAYRYYNEGELIAANYRRNVEAVKQSVQYGRVYSPYSGKVVKVLRTGYGIAIEIEGAPQPILGLLATVLRKGESVRAGELVGLDSGDTKPNNARWMEDQLREFARKADRKSD